ncbi:hypothetical protein UR09_03920 [Candidatus Nitromaritima sp. SCGC AAA799-A02]|nr:hypothetical protein UR09_03920 [Candidatus Nitromaritima sp. SCGC AAA799-A02]KMP11429.1 hypothetical protein UZ36_04460 [Candidatus Nitromaritima sp. SCGC AAA799-C22]
MSIKVRIRQPYSLILIIFLIFPGQADGDTGSSEDSRYSVHLALFDEEQAEKFKLKLIHPYSIESSTIEKCLASLVYQERGVAWSKNMRIFKKEAINHLAPLIAEQFARVDKSQRVVFKIRKSRRRFAIQGDTFLTPKGMHWRFTIINSSKRPLGDFSIMGASWRLVPLKGQSYKTQSPRKNLIQDITNWIVFNKFRPEPRRILPAPIQQKEKQPASQTPTKESIMKRLKILESLRDEGLINEEEYRLKRKEILGTL